VKFDQEKIFVIQQVSPNPNHQGIDPLIPVPSPGIPLTIPEIRSINAPRVPFAGSVDVNVPGRAGYAIPIRVYTPQSNPEKIVPLLIYIHGGGWVRGTLDQYDYICGKLCESGFVVASVDYRLSPEYKYPIPLNDCVDSIKWLLTNINTVIGSSGRTVEHVIVGGDSAGGHLTLSSLLKIIDQDGQLPPQIIGACPIYPYRS